MLISKLKTRYPSGSGTVKDLKRAMKALSGCLAAACAIVAFHSVEVARAAVRPNVVVIQTDDQPLAEFNARWRDLYDNQRRIMPNTMSLIRNKGIEFSKYITPFPVCAPSRASLLSGQYAQNHGVIRIGGPRGGWDAYRDNRIDQENLPVWLQRSGYRTMHFGKFMNNYGGPDFPAETTVPPGWDRWVSDATDNSTREFYGYQQNIDGLITDRLGYPYYDMAGGKDPVGCPDLGQTLCNYHTDSMNIQAESEIRGAGSQPFYLQIDYHTPHGDSRPPSGPEPANRDYDTALRTESPKPPGYNEPGISDKPSFIRSNPRLSAGEIFQMKIEYQKSIEALQSVDDGVKGIVDALRETGKLKNTYIVFTSDNGFFFGEHRINRGKLLPYEPALRVPFVMRGPGIKAGSKSKETVANQDIAPTILKLTGAKARSKIDGRSMIRYWRNTKKRSRRPILLSSYQQATRFIPGDYPDEPPVVTPDATKGAQTSVKAANQNYVGIRVGPYKYVEYEVGDGELYVIPKDPAELHNRFGKRRYKRVQKYLDRELTKLRACKGASCRASAKKWPRPPGR
ncbi:MAG: sulfatase [Solirubrobacterales bacterium]|nr:sulfatase [Solirubrobacterales bacterium]